MVVGGCRWHDKAVYRPQEVFEVLAGDGLWLDVARKKKGGSVMGQLRAGCGSEVTSIGGGCIDSPK